MHYPQLNLLGGQLAIDSSKINACHLEPGHDHKRVALTEVTDEKDLNTGPHKHVGSSHISRSDLVDSAHDGAQVYRNKKPTDQTGYNYFADRYRP